MANRNDEALRDEVLSVVRAVEALKGECGMNPESPQAIRNGQYASISARLYCVYEALTPRPEPAEAMDPISRAISDVMRPGGGTGIVRVEYVDPASIRAEAMGGEDADLMTPYERLVEIRRLRAELAALSRPEPAGRVECRECKGTGVFYWHDGPTKRAATCPCRRRAAHAPQEGAE